MSSLSTAQVQLLFGNTLDNYRSAVKAYGMEPVIEDIAEEARLLWIGPKRTDKVILYLHGGGLFFPPMKSQLDMIRHLQVELKGAVGTVVLNYGLYPDTRFPTTLRQVKAAIMHLLGSGVRPENLYLIGDSAGGNLALQATSHILHPLEGVEPLMLGGKLGGVALISPTVSLTADSASHFTNEGKDMLTRRLMHKMQDPVLKDVPETAIPYLEAAKAPESWFEGVDSIVDRILVTVGGYELLRDDIVVAYEKLKSHHPRITYYYGEEEVHVEAMIDTTTSAARVTVEWFKADARFIASS
ncbi:alpha/beta-hydrolase [Fistulina hepatica ATCC 64428]|uniref:Alpha/beta-hydrolase n=1 Tax=Fistulina hepatica ATCC 64428 TaxID=1128425 RepID=A0A0D7AE28_9AGAR|nr:alpha/beta-hydrolase [Fistulina hepatica ATCC 64428]